MTNIALDNAYVKEAVQEERRLERDIRIIKVFDKWCDLPRNAINITGYISILKEEVV